MRRMLVQDVVTQYAPGSHDQPWSWDDEAQSLLDAPCPTELARAQGVDVERCPDPYPGCYQRAYEEHIKRVGVIEQGICLGSDGRIWDGHHSIVAALRLGITEIPIEDD